MKKELDGIFFDTVGNIDSYLLGSQQQKQNEAIKVFVKKIKIEYDDLLIAQNWGFEKYTAPYVDFIMWEDFSYSEKMNGHNKKHLFSVTN